MEFRLLYDGPLPSASRSDNRTEHKHRLRKHFHHQLRELWRQQPDLREQGEDFFTEITTPQNMRSDPGPLVRQIYRTKTNQLHGKKGLDYIADAHQLCGGRFVPLVRKSGGFTCKLDILFLRRDNPGNLIRSGGDIDNRIKVLLDGLKMAKTQDDLGGFSIDEDEAPFFCLLEDDSLITSLSVTADRLLTPSTGNGHTVHHVFLVIRVTIVNESAIFADGRIV